MENENFKTIPGMANPPEKRCGIIPKAVMVDPDLSIYSKGIYAYFCTAAGLFSENTYSAPVKSILADLGISSSTFYLHLAPLLDDNLIEVCSKQSRNTYQTYTVVATPKKYLSPATRREMEPLYAAVRSHGIYGPGCGFVPMALMQDHNLDLKAKALYAYYASNNALAPKDRIAMRYIQDQFPISESALKKYHKQLFDNQYLARTRPLRNSGVAEGGASHEQ